jgi:hypothetical protein
VLCKTGAFSTHLDALSTTQKEEEIRGNFFGGIGRIYRDDFDDFFWNDSDILTL